MKREKLKHEYQQMVGICDKGATPGRAWRSAGRNRRYLDPKLAEVVGASKPAQR